MYIHRHAYVYVCIYYVAITFHMHLAIQTGATPIMVAAMRNHYNVVSLLKNKYGQQEPTAEDMVSHVNIDIIS